MLSHTLTADPPQYALQLRSFHCMGTHINLYLLTSPEREARTARALEREEMFLRSADQRMSRFKPDSEISRLNDAGEGTVSPLTFDAIWAALEAAKATQGLFDPTMLRHVVAAGYDRSFEELSDEGPRGHGGLPVSSCKRYREVTLDPISRRVKLPPETGIDLGGFAKGWLADAVACRLDRYGPALVDCGGDIAVAGQPPDREGWEIEIESPFDDSQTLAVLTLAAGGVATSGTLRRRWRTDEGWAHHIIDPRTGRPAESDLVSVTVAAPTAAAAEAAAKVVLILGEKAGTERLASAQGYGGLLVTTEGETRIVGHLELAG